MKVLPRFLHSFEYNFINKFIFFFRKGAGKGAGKLSMDELEQSLAQIKEMLKERSNIIEHLTPPIANNY